MYTVGQETVYRNRVTTAFFKYCQPLIIARRSSLTDHKHRNSGDKVSFHTMGPLIQKWNTVTCVQSFKPYVKTGETDLPAFVSCSVVGVVLCDVRVYSIQCELLIWSHGDGLDYELCVRIWRFGVVLLRKEEKDHGTVDMISMQNVSNLCCLLSLVYFCKQNDCIQTGRLSKVQPASGLQSLLSCYEHWAISRL